MLSQSVSTNPHDKQKKCQYLTDNNRLIAIDVSTFSCFQCQLANLYQKRTKFSRTLFAFFYNLPMFSIFRKLVRSLKLSMTVSIMMDRITRLHSRRLALNAVCQLVSQAMSN